MGWSFQPIFDSYLLVAGLIFGLAGLLWIRPHFPNASPARNRVLNGLRAATLLLLAFAMLRPAILWTDKRKETATVAFLVDQSRSMNVPDAGNRTRWQSVGKTLEDAWPVLAELQDNYEIQFYLMDRQATHLPLATGMPPLPEAATGDETDIGTSLDDLIRAEAGKRLAAVFLLSDGTQRSSEPRVDAEQPARELARRACPLFSISYGEARDQTQSRDVAVKNLPDQYTVFLNNELEVEATIQIQGYTGRDIPVEMVVIQPDGTTQQIGPVNAIADQQNQQVRVKLSYTPQQVGQHKLTVGVEPQIGEQGDGQ